MGVVVALLHELQSCFRDHFNVALGEQSYSIFMTRAKVVEKTFFSPVEAIKIEKEYLGYYRG